MSDNVYRLIEHVSKKYGSVCQFAMMAMVIALSAGIVHCISFMIYDLTPSYLQPWMLFFEKVFILTIMFMMMWYYHKSRILLQRHATHENQLQLFIRHTPAAVAMLDRNMNYMIISDRWLEDYNIPQKDIIGKNHYDIFPMIKENPVWLNDHRRALDLGETTRREEDNFIGLSGKREWITYEILPWQDDKGKIGGLIFYTEVITARMEILQKLRESEARFARAMRGSNDGIFDWDVQNNIVYFSPRFKRFLGYNENEVANTFEGFMGLLHPDDVEPLKKKVEDHLYRHEPYLAEYRLRQKDGEYVWIEARGQTEWDTTGKPTYFSGAMSDISERKRLEELRKEFVYVVTHELRTPLSALRGALDMLPHLLGGELPQKAERSLDLALQGCERLALLVDDLLAAGRAETDQLSIDFEQCDIMTLLKNAIEIDAVYGEKHGVRFELISELHTCDVHLDRGRFLQVMANLLSNAAKFSPCGSVVQVAAHCDPSHVTVSVKDQGPGIPEDFRHKIFQKFARGQSDKPGTGLGLNIAKTIVEKMHGKIWYETEAEKGTTFFVQFPVI